MMDKKDIARLAFLIYPHITKTALEEPAVESLAGKVRDIHRGLSPEDELAAKICWLGNCAGINRIDQTPMEVVEVEGKMRVPDFIAFPIINGAPFPVLIEVKSKHEEKLDFAEPYLLSLRRFAERVSLPLLIAWKCGGLWMFFDHREIKKNVTGYRITLMDAVRQDLSTALFRDLRIVMNPDLELILDMELLDEIEGGAGEVIPEAVYSFQITNAAFYNNGRRIEKYAPQHFSLFLATPDETEFRRTGKQTFQQIYRPEKDHGFHLSNVLTAQLSMVTEGDTEIDWHKTITKPLPSSGLELRNSLQSAIDLGFVRYVMDIIPNDWPDFLPQRNASATEN